MGGTQQEYEFRPEDRPIFPGGQFAPPHPPWRRLGYAAIGLWAGATASFVNATVTVNVPNLAGPYAAYVAELSWLPAIFVAANACANTALIKARAQFSMPHVMRILLVLYAAAAILRFFVPGFGTEALVRFLSGLAAAGMSTMCIYYVLQALPPKARPLSVIIGLGFIQLGTPLARTIPVDVLTAQGGFGQHCIELAYALATLALLDLLPLPPTPRLRAFRPLDALTVTLILVSMLLICGVINRGRIAWWTDTQWLGICLAVAIPLLTVAVAIEALRKDPLIQVAWMGTREFLWFAAVALLVRVALAEQTYGAVGLLTAGNLDNDQLRTLFGWVVLAMLAGTTVCALTFSEKALPAQVIAASLAIALGAWLDSHASNLTRPEQLYLSQSLIGFGACLFVGPTLGYGMLRVLRLGPRYLVTVVVMFSMTQNVGGLIGSALLGSYQTVATRSHFRELADRMAVGDEQVGARIQGAARSLSGLLVDPGLRAQQGAASVGAAALREANVLAFNDVSRLVWRLALATALLVAVFSLISMFRPARRMEPA
ncbi:MAG: transporter [Ramlibacter sp.]|nr:transporter [Ramlibacter sp.]